jgi:ribosomal protein L18E
MEKKCSRCEGPRDRVKQRYCRLCHAAYMRETRPAYKNMSEQAKKKSRARAYANVYKIRGVLPRGSCFICGAEQAEMHHEDYDKPIDVVWLCRPCHLDHHKD